MKLDYYQCSRCSEEFSVESGTLPDTLIEKYEGDKDETVHLCPNCWTTYLFFKEHVQPFDKLTDQLPPEHSERDIYSVSVKKSKKLDKEE